jgi:hypothetical protein
LELKDRKQREIRENFLIRNSDFTLLAKYHHNDKFEEHEILRKFSTYGRAKVNAGGFGRKLKYLVLRESERAHTCRN